MVSIKSRRTAEDSWRYVFFFRRDEEEEEKKTQEIF